MITFILTDQLAHYFDIWLQDEKKVFLQCSLNFTDHMPRYTALMGKITFSQIGSNDWEVSFDDSLREWAIIGRLSI